MTNHWPSILAAIVLTLVSGVGDSYGFIHASAVWHEGQLVVGELGRSLMGFAIGIGTYLVIIRFLNRLGVTSTEVQTIGWFGVTIVGVAIISGDITRWALVGRVIAVICVACIGWLLVHAEA